MDSRCLISQTRLIATINKPAAFTVDFHGAQGRLDARVVAPSGAEDEAIVQEVDKDRYAVRFIPRENGLHYIHVRLSGAHIPGSPFRVFVGQTDADAGRVRAYGEGLSKGRVGEPAAFIVSTVNAGSGALAVTVDGPSKVALNCREVDEGYEFTYSPSAPGDYLITIKYAGNVHIPGSPFKARITGAAGVTPQQGKWTEQSQVVVETVTKSSTTHQYAAPPAWPAETGADASKVVTSGPGLNRDILGQDTNINVDAANAGKGMLMVGMLGPSCPVNELHVRHLGRQQYSVTYRAHERGQHSLAVTWGGRHVPGSPWNVIVN
jgi:filamin